MSGANPWRGEVRLEVGDETHVLRPTFAALVAAEEELGPLLALVERASAGEIRLSEIVALFWHCLHHRPGQERAERGEFAQKVLAKGLAGCSAPLRQIIGQILQGTA